MVDNALRACIELGTVAIEVVLIVLYSNRMKMMSNVSIVTRLISYFLFFLPLALMSLCPVMPVIRVVYSFVGLTILYRLCYNIDLANSIYTTALFLILSVVSDIICSYCLSWMNITNTGFSDNAFDRIAYNVIAKLIHLILIQIAPFILKPKQAQRSFVGALPLLTAQFASLVICICVYFSGIDHQEVAPQTIIGVLATLYVNLIICFYVEAISARNELAREKEIAEREYQYNIKYYESIKKSQEETRALWHEIKNYMNTIHTLVDGGDNQAAFQCLTEVEQVYDSLTVNVDVGNNIISGILSIGLQQAKQYHIPFHVDAWVSSVLGVAPQDLFIILGNAIDNAIEECSQHDEPDKTYINVSIHQKGGLLAIRVENPCRAKPTPKPGKIHGYGLKNVKRCIEKYEGELQVNTNEGIFSFFAMLNMKVPVSGEEAQ